MTFPETTLAASHLDPAQLKVAMRRLFGGVSVITVGDGDTSTGLTLTSTVPLSTDPPLILICVNRSSSSWPVIVGESRFCVNLLDARHQPVAERFSGWAASRAFSDTRALHGGGSRPGPGVSRSSIALSRNSSSVTATRS